MSDEIRFHPLADIFPLMEGEEFDALVADIKAHGLNEPIITYEGMILDGRNRYRALQAAGGVAEYELQCILENKAPDMGWSSFRQFRPLAADIDPDAFVVSANIHRRHLTAEQKRELIAKLIKAKPEKSDRQIAKTAKASPTTVGTVRAEMEAAGDVSKLDTRTDSKGREQPAKKKTKAAKPAERNRMARERREAERKRKVEEAAKQRELEEAARQARAKELAVDLISGNRDLAQRLVTFKQEYGVGFYDLVDALADTAKAVLHAAKAQPTPVPDDGLDIPECLRRAPKAEAVS